MNLRSQQGISLVMALVMLVVLSMIAVSATYSTTSSLRVVGNMQASDEAVAAAQYWVEKELSSLSNFSNTTATLPPQTTQMGTGSYTVTVTPPVCLSSTPMSGNSASMASTNGAAGAPPNDTYWEFNVTAQDNTSGAAITVTQGVRTRIYASQGC